MAQTRLLLMDAWLDYPSPCVRKTGGCGPSKKERTGVSVWYVRLCGARSLCLNVCYSALSGLRLQLSSQVGGGRPHRLTHQRVAFQ